MRKVTIKELYRQTETFLNTEIEVSGWIKTVRVSKTFGFIELNDGSFFKNLQIVFEEGINNFKDVSKLTVGSSLCIKGLLIESPGAKQPFEMKASEVEIIGLSDSDYPLQKESFL